MTPSKQFVHLKQQGTILLVSMIFIIVFSALAVSMATLSGTNAQIADNQRKADGARAAAESGLEIIRNWIGQVSIPGSTPQHLKFNEITKSFRLKAYEISNVSATYDSSSIKVSSVKLNSQAGQSFYASILPLPSPAEINTLQVNVAGVYGTLSRTIRVNFQLGERAHTVFDFGVATKGPLSLAGNVELGGVNVRVESSVYIESKNSNLALSMIGNSKIAGDVSIVNPIAAVDLGGKASVGGETGQAAIKNHVKFGVPPTEFPEPNPGYFEPYVINVVNSNTNTKADATFENVRILAGTNPNFTGRVELRGIVFIETPNIVRFGGTTDVTGIIVGDGDWTNDSGSNRIIFDGTVNSLPVTQLPDEQKFAGIRDKTGTFVIAPGFRLSFGGNFKTLSGAIAGNGIEFYGDAGGTINGSVINYANTEMTLNGNSDLYFNRSGLTKGPAGFVPEIVLQYDPSSYSEIVI